MRTIWMAAGIAMLLAGCSAGTDAPVAEGNPSDVDLAKAVTSGDEAKVRQMIQANPNLLNSPNAVGETPLHYAARAKNSSMIKALLEMGADPSMRNDSEETPMQVAAEAGAGQDVLELLQGGGQPSP